MRKITIEIGGKEFYNTPKHIEEARVKANEEVKQEALEIATKFPATVSKNVDWLDYNKKDKLFTPRVNGVTKFDAFQDVTDILSHTNKLGFDGVNFGLQAVDKILVRQEVSQ